VEQTQSRVKQRATRKSEDGGGLIQVKRNLDYQDWCVWECLKDPVLCQELLLPPPGIEGVGAFDLWPKPGRRLWYTQLKMVLSKRIIASSGKSVGKTETGIVGHMIYRAINFPNSITCFIAPQETHLDRIYYKVRTLFTHHPILRFWLPTKDMLTANSGNRKARSIILRNNFQLQGVIPGLHGKGFKGQRATAVVVDEGQDIPQEACDQLTEMLERPFNPDKGSEEKWFGVPNGDRTSHFFYLSTRDHAFKNFVARLPHYVHKGVTEDEFITQISRYHCRWERVNGEVVVREWTNSAAQHILGHWGEPSTSCFPISIYEPNTIAVMDNPDNYNFYRHVIIQPSDCYVNLTNYDMREPEKLNDLLYLYDKGREQFNPREVAISIDPGKRMSTVFIWMKWHPTRAQEWERWWLIRQYAVTNFISGIEQARIVHEIAKWWGADWIATDSSSLSAYMSDSLAVVGQQRTVLKNPEDWLKTEVLPQPVYALDFSGRMAVDFDDDDKPILRLVDVETVRICQDLMSPIPSLVLPTDWQDNELYNEMMSYRERQGDTGRRFLPPHPHRVSAFKVFAGALFLQNLYGKHKFITNNVEIPERTVVFY
jgi:hypothetical protein